MSVKRAIERDCDFRALKMCVKYLGEVSSERMRRPTLEFLWDKFVLQPERDRLRKGEKS